MVYHSLPHSLLNINLANKLVGFEQFLLVFHKYKPYWIEGCKLLWVKDIDRKPCFNYTRFGIFLFNYCVCVLVRSGDLEVLFALLYYVTSSSSFQLLCLVCLFVTPWTAALQGSLSITSSHTLLKLMSIESVMPSNNLILHHSLLLLPSIFPSIRAFSDGSVVHIRWPKYWNFTVSPFNKYSGLISFRIDWLDLLVVQGTLESLFQHHRSKASILHHSAFFIAHLSHPYMTIGKTIALTRQTFVGKLMSLLFKMLSKLVITVFLRSKQVAFNFMATITIYSDFGAPPK